MGAPFEYQACGLKIRSALQLPGNSPPGPDGEPDVVIEFGETPQQLPNEVVEGAAFSAGHDEFLLRVPNVGRFHVTSGSRIVIDPAAGATEDEIRLFLLGSAFGAVLHMRDYLPLHAGAVQVGDGCVAFAGDSGIGKSTLVAMLGQRGYPIVTDDVCAVKVLPGAGPVVYPGFRRLKLWADSLEALEISQSNATKVRPALEKFEVHDLPSAEGPWIPLRRIYLLRETRDDKHDPVGIVPVEGATRLRALIYHTYRIRYMDGIGAKPAHVRTCAEIVKTTPLFRWWRRRNYENSRIQLDELERDWEKLENETPCPT